MSQEHFVVIYTKEHCPYCVKAKILLQRKNINFQEIKIIDDVTREEMIRKTNGAKTVPQIFINSKLIGGCDDLYALESNNELDVLLLEKL